MAVNAPLVKYYEDVLNDGSPTGDVKEITLWDAGIVDAGTTSADKIIYIWNNKDNASEDHSDMQNVKLGVVSNEVGSVGNKDGWVYDNNVIKVTLNAHDPSTESVHLGKDSSSSGAEFVLPLTAKGLNESDKDEQNRIRGTKGTTNLTDGVNNYAKVTACVDLSAHANAAAGQHKFRLRTTYSYT